MTSPAPFQSAQLSSSNPFQQPTGGNTPTGNPFMQPPSGGKKYPKFEQLFGRLVVMRGHDIEVVPKNPNLPNYKPGDTEERATADLVVLDGGPLPEPCEGEPIPALFERMWFNQGSIVGALKGGMKKGMPVLGRVYRFPTKDSVSDFPTRQAIEEGFVTWANAGFIGNKPLFTWKLEQYTEDELAVAMKWLESNPDFLK